MKKSDNIKKTSNRYNTENKQYLIACDLDGTLLNSEQKLSQETIRTIKEVSKQGHKVCLITGRPVQGALDIYQQLELDTILCNLNGAVISNPSDKNFQTINLTYSREVAKKIFSNKELMKNFNNVLIETVNQLWLLNNPDNNMTIAQMLSKFHLIDRDLKFLNGDLDKIDTDVCAIFLQVDDLENIGSIIYEIKKIAPTLKIRAWNFKMKGAVIEVNGVHSSKKNALEYLSTYYGIPLENTIAFGDGDNDVEMLATATWGFAMKNATSASRLAARYMTKHNHNDDGVVRELKKFLKM